MRARNVIALFLIVILVAIGIVPTTNQNAEARFANAQSSNAVPGFIELGYGPGSLASIADGIPIYSPGDSMWLLSTSSVAVSAEIISPSSVVVARQSISNASVSRIYTFSDESQEGTWTLDITLKNSTVLSIGVPFVNPINHPVQVSMSNFSLQTGDLNLGFAVSPSDAYNFEGCLASSDVNSTIAVPIPSSIGRGEMLLNGSTQSTTVSIKGTTSQTFSFWYQLDYSYSYLGNLTGEIISRDVSTISSSTAAFVSVSPITVSLTNSTSPRPGKYDLDAFFDSASGLAVEQTSVILLASGNLLWTGDCNPVRISGASFTLQSNLALAPQTWPTSLYLMYQVDGVGSYATLGLNLNPARIHFLGSLGNATLYYLSYTMESNPNVLASNEYNGTMYLIGKSFPLSVQVTPSFGSEDLKTQSVEINAPFTDNEITIPVGALKVTATNNSALLTGAKVSIENQYGGSTSTHIGSTGSATVYLPAGQYNVTVTSEGKLISKNVELSTNTESSLLFPFENSATFGFLPYLLISTLIIAILINIYVWLMRPRRNLN